MRTHPRIAIPYTLGALAFAAIIPWSGQWALLPMWLATLLAIFALAYWFNFTNVYHKNHGRIRATALLAAAPHVIGTAIARRLTARQMTALAHEIVPGLWLGRLLNQQEAISVIAQLGLVAVVDMTAEHSEPAALRQLKYLNLPVLDMTAPSRDQIETASVFIADQIKNGAVYVHCGNGIARSAAVVAGYLLLSEIATGTDQACALVSQRRPDVVWRPQLVAAVNAFNNQLKQSRRFRTQSAPSQAAGST